MQTCYNCGKQVSDETLICPECGALVRRYTDTPPHADAPPAPQPVVPLVPVQDSKCLRFRGGLKAWLIFLIVTAAYMALTFLAGAYLAPHMAELMGQLPAADQALLAEAFGNLDEFLALMEQMRPVCFVMSFLFAGKLACHIWLLRARRRRAFSLSIGLSLAALIGLGLLGGTSLAIVYFFDPLITWLWLRRLWPMMEK